MLDARSRAACPTKAHTRPKAIPPDADPTHRTMHVLRRTVRFALPPLTSADDRSTAIESLLPHESRHNPYSSWPPAHTARGVGAFFEIVAEVRGEPDPQTGYLLNITTLDHVVRSGAVPLLTRRFADQFLAGRPIDPARTTRDVARAIRDALALDAEEMRAARYELAAVVWNLTPTLRYRHELTMPDRVELRQQFEFSAAHRLHCRTLDPAANRAIFGKCNNPNGHGHNYRIEVGATVPLGEPSLGATPFTVSMLDRIVDEVVLRRLDHTHLNLDVPEFAELNPSVEHIAKVCHDLLRPALRAHGAELTTVTVWETEKTCCTYPAPASTASP